VAVSRQLIKKWQKYKENQEKSDKENLLSNFYI
jgi:hypothetical protein